MLTDLYDSPYPLNTDIRRTRCTANEADLVALEVEERAESRMLMIV